MKARIRNWLGLAEDRKFLSDQIAADFMALHNELYELRKTVSSSLTAQARLIAKLEPNFAKSEFDPDRKAESDRLGEKVINRIKAEDWARKHTTGETEDAPPK